MRLSLHMFYSFACGWGWSALWYFHGVIFLSGISTDATCSWSYNSACKVYIRVSCSSVLKSLTRGDETNSNCLLVNMVRNWDQIIVLKHTAQSSCAAEFLKCVWYRVISRARQRRSHWCWETKELRTCCNVHYGLPAYPQYGSDQRLKLSASLKALERPCLSCAVGRAMPSGGVSASTSISSPTLAFAKVCRKLCIVETHFGWTDLLGLRASWLKPKICDRFVFCSNVLLAFNSGLRWIVWFRCVGER